MIRKSIKHNGWLLNIIGLIIVIIYLSPIYWMIITSFKSQSEIFQAVPTLIPKDFQFNSYIDQFGSGLGQMTLNSFIIAISSMIIVIIVSIPAAYALARFRVKGAKLILLFFLITQMMPTTVSLAPLFILFKNLGILNTYIAPILATSTGGIAFSILLLRPYFLSAPKALEEAALLDGCNRFTAFIRVMIPVVMPGILVCAAISFLFAWGDLISSLTFIRDQELWPLTAGIYNAIGRYGTEYNYLMAFGTIAVIPVIILFVALQKYLVKGLAAGSVK
ncbi:carbohydrate ABC transporter permease [Oceanobacillus damuensis]|uniref:carbohydrate ABC transporter permease n=1 Tax=Oceanobacillus damuensis TaxID=937928 RepID=UPI00082D72E6|nr:carbohydrate ABC transporter permease [Oceanobacillus damuensis]